MTPSVGRCADPAPTVVPEAPPIICALPAGHAGWHRGDQGCEWGLRAGPSPRTAVMSWDCRQQPNLDELDRHVHDLSGCRLRIYPVDTGSDEYAIVISARPLDDGEPERVWRRWWEEER